MKSSKGIALIRVLKLIKQKRKKFYRAIWARWAQRDFLTQPGRSFWLYYERYKENPNLAAELQIISDALTSIDYKGSRLPGILEAVHREYMPRFHKYYMTPMVQRNGGIFPHLARTETIKELIARGWIHEDDSDVFSKENALKVYLKCHVAPLVWPEVFEHHQDAIGCNDRMGIPGRTGTVLPKR